MDQRRNGCARIPTVAEYLLVGERMESRKKFFSDRFLYQQSGAGQADLARIVVLTSRFSSRGIKVCIGKNDERTLATKFCGERHNISRGMTSNFAGRLW